MGLLEVLRSIDLSLVALTVMGTIVCGVVWSWHVQDDEFCLRQVLLDGTTGKISIEKVGYMTALSIGTWGFVALILKEQLTEWYAGLYLGAFVLGRLGNSWIVRKDAAQEPRP
jgi:hypothetical protein